MRGREGTATGLAFIDIMYGKWINDDSGECSLRTRFSLAPPAFISCPLAPSYLLFPLPRAAGAGCGKAPRR